MTRRRPAAAAAVATTVLAWLAMAVSASASTYPDPSPPPCDLGTNAVVAGVPLQLTGRTSGAAGSVGIFARAASGTVREGTVAILDGTWRGLILFGADDGGAWTVEVNVDDVACASRITVSLPAGVVAPATGTPAAAEALDGPPPGFDRDAVLGAVAIGATALVAGSWLFLIGAGLTAVFGARPLRRRSVSAVARLAVFVAILGTTVGAALVVEIVVSLSHFDSGVPAGQQALLDVLVWGAVIGGSVLGVLAARRVRGAARSDAAAR